jgi:hypothetical protein
MRQGKKLTEVYSASEAKGKTPLRRQNAGILKRHTGPSNIENLCAKVGRGLDK